MKKDSSDMGSLVYDRKMLALNPLGGSFVIFTPVVSQLIRVKR